MKNLKIDDLKVKSFVTSFDAKKAETMKGGVVQILSIGKHCTHADNGCYGTKHSDGVFCNPH